jgi:hypothetical protein
MTLNKAYKILNDKKISLIDNKKLRNDLQVYLFNDYLKKYYIKKWSK